MLKSQFRLGFWNDTFFAALFKKLGLLECFGAVPVGGFQEDIKDLSATGAAKMISLSVKRRRNVSMAQGKTTQVANSFRF